MSWNIPPGRPGAGWKPDVPGKRRCSFLSTGCWPAGHKPAARCCQCASPLRHTPGTAAGLDTDEPKREWLETEIFTNEQVSQHCWVLLDCWYNFNTFEYFNHRLKGQDNVNKKGVFFRKTVFKSPFSLNMVFLVFLACLLVFFLVMEVKY